LLLASGLFYAKIYSLSI